MRIHELSHWEILTIRNDLEAELQGRMLGEHRRIFFIIKDEDEADNDDDLTFQIEGNHPLRMVAIK